MIVSDEQGRRVRLGSKIGSGGEGDILEVPDEPRLVAKLYRQPTAERIRKLEAMQRNPPPPLASNTGHVAICWPQRLLFRSGAGVGFLMPRVDISRSYELFKLYNHLTRIECLPGFTWAYLLRTGLNLASLVATLHARGYVIGDLNESNLLVTRSALVALVDCDSMQVPAPDGGCFRCTVMKPDFTAPELQGVDLKSIDRTPAHDCFALGVMLFHVLMEGVHPFAGVWKDPAGEEPAIDKRIRYGHCPYTTSASLDPMPGAPPFDILPEQLRTLFMRCFSAGSEAALQRPTAMEWRAALSASQAKLRHCDSNDQHVYGDHSPACPWCERTRVLCGDDPFPPLQKPIFQGQDWDLPPRLEDPKPARTDWRDWMTRGWKFGGRTLTPRNLGVPAAVLVTAGGIGLATKAFVPGKPVPPDHQWVEPPSVKPTPGPDGGSRPKQTPNTPPNGGGAPPVHNTSPPPGTPAPSGGVALPAAVLPSTAVEVTVPPAGDLIEPRQPIPGYIAHPRVAPTTVIAPPPLVAPVSPRRPLRSHPLPAPQGRSTGRGSQYPISPKSVAPNPRIQGNRGGNQMPPRQR